MTYSSNRYLSLTEMTVNARYIYNYFVNEGGWTPESVCAMLGNMQTESTINPGLYESMNSSSTTNGYGLVQWTPNTKYKNWVDNLGGGDYGNIDTQMFRIEWELANNQQWIETNDYPLSFGEFVSSHLSPEYLAQVFIRNYERPANQNQPLRSTQARYWYNLLYNGTNPVDPPDPGETTNNKKWGKYKFILFKRNRRIYG